MAGILEAPPAAVLAHDATSASLRREAQSAVGQSVCKSAQETRCSGDVALPLPRHQNGQTDLSWVDEYTDDAKGVKEFCRLHDLSAPLMTALNLANAMFPAVQCLRVGVREDPENGAEWLIVRVVAGCSPEEAQQAYMRFIASWVASVPRFKRGLVRLSYGVG